MNEGRFNSNFEQSGSHLDRVGFFSLNFRIKAWYFGVFQYNNLSENQKRVVDSRSLSNGEQRVENRTITLNLEGNTRGLGVARRFGKWKAGLTINHLELSGQTQYLRTRRILSIPPSFTGYQSEIDDTDDAWGFSLGFLHEPNPQFSWGVVWRENPRFTLVEDVREDVDLAPLFFEQYMVPFVAPDVFGAGVRYKIRPELSVLLDWQKIFYSQIIRDGFQIVGSSNTEAPEDYDIRDIDEFHVGFEWLLAGAQSVWAFRGGYYRNPLHAVTYNGDDLVIQDRFAGAGLSDENHVTFGVGWVFRNRFEIDISANIWEIGREWTASFIWRKK